MRALILLGVKSYLLRFKGMLPKILRGSHYGSIEQVLKDHNIPCRTVSKVSTDEFMAYLKGVEPDVVLSSNSLIFSEELIAVPKIATVNRHSALLPSMGGLLPALRAIQLGEKHFGASVHVMVKKIDAGRVLSRKWFPLEVGDTVDRMYQHAFFLSYEATNEALAKLKQSPVPFCGDEGIKPSYFSFPETADWEDFKANNGRFI